MNGVHNTVSMELLDGPLDGLVVHFTMHPSRTVVPTRVRFQMAKCQVVYVRRPETARLQYEGWCRPSPPDVDKGKAK